MSFKVGDKVCIDHEKLKGHICEIIEINTNMDYIIVSHPTIDWSGHITGFSKDSRENFRFRKLTKLEKALK